MEKINTGKVTEIVTNVYLDGVGVSGLFVKLDLYNKTANTWWNGSSWVDSKPSSLNMTDNSSVFTGRYFYDFTPTIDGTYVAYSYNLTTVPYFQRETTYLAESTNDNILSISGNLNTLQTSVTNLNNTMVADFAIVNANIDAAESVTISLSGTMLNDFAIVNANINAFANIGTITADVKKEDGSYVNGVLIKDIDMASEMVYIAYKDSNGLLKTVSRPFSQDGIIASGVGN